LQCLLTGHVKKIKDVFVANITSRRDIDVKEIFGNPIYERLIGSYDSINKAFDGSFDSTINDLKSTFIHVPNNNIQPIEILGEL